jgi:adenylate cyclase
LGRPDGFDPQTDPIVRVEATRLRRALDRYYTTEGAKAELRIVMPRGGYAVEFETGQPGPSSTATSPKPHKRTRRQPRIVQIAAIVALIITASVGAGFALWPQFSRTFTVTEVAKAPPLQPTSLVPNAESMPVAIGSLPFKPRLAAIAVAHDLAIPGLSQAITSVMSHFDGFAVYDASVLVGPPPDDLYVLEAQISDAASNHIELRLTHAASRRILWARPITPPRDNDGLLTMAKKFAVEIVGREGMIFSDALPPNGDHTSLDGKPHACLATVIVAIRAKDRGMSEPARTCLDRLKSLAPNSAILMSLSAQLRIIETGSDPELMMSEAKRAYGLDPHNAMALQSMASAVETQNFGLALRYGDLAVERNPFDPTLLREHAKRLNEAGLVGRAEQLFSEADSLDQL